VRFKLDEDTPLRLAALLRERGHDADTVQDEGLTGSPDSRIAQAAKDEQRILISLDLGFSDIRAHPPGSHPGIIVIRPRGGHGARAVAEIFTALLDSAHFGDDLTGRITIVDPQRIRVRR
jgi:predicted nuclease of predicted toxin-antitoxin system